MDMRQEIEEVGEDGRSNAALSEAEKENYLPHHSAFPFARIKCLQT